MKYKNLILFFGFLFFFGCKDKSKEEVQYPRWIGDIGHNNAQDEEGFAPCNGEDAVFQYFNLADEPAFNGEKNLLVEYFKTQYETAPGQNQNGMIRIRFMVNCKGKAGRFRMIQSDNNYQEFSFAPEVTQQLMNLTKGIDRWKILYREESPLDYYFYLIFKIRDGQIEEILP